MGQVSKAVAWICIFSTPLIGCYTPVVIDPNGKEKEELSGTEIMCDVTTDGKRYDFVETPKVDQGSGMIVGQSVVTTQVSDTQKLSISPAAVARTGMTESGTITSWLHGSKPDSGRTVVCEGSRETKHNYVR
jgi:hypothetical protein